MRIASFEAVVGALNEAGVPFIVVRGIAVVAHGYDEVPVTSISSSRYNRI